LTVVSNTPLTPYDVKASSATDSKLIQHVFSLSPIVPEAFDDVVCTDDGAGNATATYKSSGATVCTVNLTYTVGTGEVTRVWRV